MSIFKTALLNIQFEEMWGISHHEETVLRVYEVFNPNIRRGSACSRWLAPLSAAKHRTLCPGYELQVRVVFAIEYFLELLAIEKIGEGIECRRCLLWRLCCQADLKGDRSRLGCERSRGVSSHSPYFLVFDDFYISARANFRHAIRFTTRLPSSFGDHCPKKWRYQY